MKKLGIPDVPFPGGDRQRFDEAVKLNLEVISGRRGTKIAKLPATATAAEIAIKINEIIDMLQG